MATIEHRNGSYRIIVSCGYDLEKKQILKKLTWTPDAKLTPKQVEKELQRQTVLFEDKCKSGRHLDSSINFATFSEKWFTDYAEKQLKKKTVARYKDLMKRINPAIGHIKLDKLQPQHLLQFYSNLEEAGIKDNIKYKTLVGFKDILKDRGFSKVKFSELAGVSISVINSCVDGKNINLKSVQAICKALSLPQNDIFIKCESTPLSSKTISHYHRLISSILNTAVDWQVLYDNPCTRVKPPKILKKETLNLDDKQTALLLAYLEAAPIKYKTIVFLLLYTGFRRGELCGLEWKDIDFDNSIIRVERASLYLSTEGVYEDSTKSYSSQRVLKVSESAMKLLKEWKGIQDLEIKDLKNIWIDHDKIFTQWNGKPIHPDTISNWFSEFVKANNLPSVSIHSLRHTNASLMLANGVPIKTVSSRLGHAQVSTTMNIYAHAIRSQDEIAAETLQDILKPNNNETNPK